MSTFSFGKVFLLVLATCTQPPLFIHCFITLRNFYQGWLDFVSRAALFSMGLDVSGVIVAVQEGVWKSSFPNKGIKSMWFLLVLFCTLVLFRSCCYCAYCAQLPPAKQTTFQNVLSTFIYSILIVFSPPFKYDDM